MAQVLKDEIREKIRKAALQEFFDKGYKSAAMRNIALEAKIPTGLIYSYYKNKEELFLCWYFAPSDRLGAGHGYWRRG